MYMLKYNNKDCKIIREVFDDVAEFYNRWNDLNDNCSFEITDIVGYILSSEEISFYKRDEVLFGC